MKRLFILALVMLLLGGNCAIAEDSGYRNYENLPELLCMEDGTTVATPDQMQERRTELLNLFADNLYG